jgi:hypothetical protein
VDRTSTSEAKILKKNLTNDTRTTQREVMTCWFKLWWFAIKHGLWQDPVSMIVTFAQTVKIVAVLLIRKYLL